MPSELYERSEGGLNRPHRRGILEGEVRSVGAIGIDGALAGLRLREEVVGHLLKPPANIKCQSSHGNGRLITGDHVRPGSPVGLERTSLSRAGWLVGRVRRRRDASPGWVLEDPALRSLEDRDLIEGLFA